MEQFKELKEVKRELDRALSALGVLESILADISRAELVKPGILFNYYRALLDLKEALMNIKSIIKV